VASIYYADSLYVYGQTSLKKSFDNLFFCVKNDMVSLHLTFLHYVSLWRMPFHIELFWLVCPTHSFNEM